MSESKTPTPLTAALRKAVIELPHCLDGCNRMSHEDDCTWANGELVMLKAYEKLELELNEAKRKLNAIELVRGTHDCGCEVCGMGSAVCPASASSYALAIVEAKDQLTTAQQEIAELRKDKERLTDKLSVADDFIDSCRHHHGNHRSNDTWWFEWDLLLKYQNYDSAMKGTKE